MRGGLSSLPDDILSLVLEYASEEGGSTLGVALGLSHVCQRFRQLTLRMPALWCKIWDHMDLRIVSMLCARMTRPVAEITFHNVSSAVDVAPFLRFVAARSEVWCKMTHVFSSSDTAGDKDVLELMARETQQLRAPFLSRIFIRGSRLLLREGPLEDARHYYATWSMPRLTSFFAEDFVPIPLIQTPTSLTEFRICLRFEQFVDLSQTRAGERLSSLILFLGSCPALKVVTLNIDAFPEFTSFSTSNSAYLPTVETLKLSLSNCRGSVLRTFFQHARFPNISTLELRLNAHPKTELAQECLSAVLQDSHVVYERLVDLILHTPYTDQAHPLQIPFSLLSSVQHLTLSTDRTCFDKEFPDEPCLPALRSLKFKNFEDMGCEWVSILLGRLKDQGVTPEVTMIG